MRETLSDSRAWPLLAAVIVGGFLIYILQPILTPFLVAALLAYLGDPLADRLEALGLSRSLSVTVVFSTLSLIALGGLLLLIPMLSRQIIQLQANLPALIDWLQNSALPWLERNLGLAPTQFDIASVRAALTDHWQSTGSIAATVVARVTSSGLALVGLIGNLALIPVVTFYLLRDWDVLIAHIRDLLPRRIQPVVNALATECDEVVAAFLRGQFLVMLSLGAIYTTGLWLVGVDLALLVGLISGLASIVPYLGVIVGIASASLAVILQFDAVWLPLVLVWGVYLLGQVLEGFVLTPWLVGDRIGLHPVAVIFAVLAGGRLFGFTGVLLALPLAAVVMVLLRHAHSHYLGSRLYQPADEKATDRGDEPQG